MYEVKLHGNLAEMPHGSVAAILEKFPAILDQ